MDLSNKESTTFSIEAKIIPTESQSVLNQLLISKSKLSLKTKEEKQQHLSALAEDTRSRLKRSAMDIYCIGFNLLEAQKIIEHGEFLPWLRQEFGMGKTSAYEFIHVAKAFESKFPIIGNLINNITPTALYKLAAPSTCQAARDEAIDLAKVGKVVDPDVARNLIKKYQTPKTVKKQQQQFSAISQESETNQIETFVLSNTEVVENKQTTGNSMSYSSACHQDELQNVLRERDTYKAQLEALQILNEQLKLDVEKLRSELTLLQTSNNQQ
jgi:Protein of unknown function (DUF3102)